jgi:PAS domain S-box-containing protein
MQSVTNKNEKWDNFQYCFSAFYYYPGKYLNMNRFSNRKYINISFILIFLIIITLGYVTFTEVSKVYDISEERKNSFVLMDNIDKLLLNTKRAQEYQRLYTISIKEDYKHKYESLFNDAQTALVRFSQLKNDQKFISKHESLLFDSLITIATLRLEHLNRGMESLLSGKSDEYVQRLINGEGVMYMEKMYEITQEIENNEIQILLFNDSELAGSIKSTSIIVLLGTLLTSTVFLFIFVFLNNKVKEKEATEIKLLKEKELSERLLQSSIDSIFALDKNQNFILFNSGSEKLTGFRKEEVIGNNIYKVFPFLNELGEDKLIKQALRGRHSISKDRWFNIPSTRKKGYFEAYYTPVTDHNNEVTGVLAIVRNTTRRKLTLEALEKTKRELEKRVNERTADLTLKNEQLEREIYERSEAQNALTSSLQEKVILLREIHHRVKNNLQVISSLLNLQSSKIKDDSAKEIFRESRNRIRSMALIHEKLYQSKDLSRVDFSGYLHSLSGELFRSYNIQPGQIDLKAEIEGVYLHVDTSILCGLIVNELLSNSLKHAFPKGKRGEVSLSVKRNNGNYVLSVKDNGIGFPAAVDHKNTSSLGLQLVNTLTDQLGGALSLHKEPCTEFIIEFKDQLIPEAAATTHI